MRIPPTAAQRRLQSLQYVVFNASLHPFPFVPSWSSAHQRTLSNMIRGRLFAAFVVAAAAAAASGADAVASDADAGVHPNL